MIQALQAIKNQGHGRKQVILTDWKCNSSVRSVQAIQDGKLKIAVEFDYGDIDS
jgi:hypothetical protein